MAKNYDASVDLWSVGVILYGERQRKQKCIRHIVCIVSSVVEHFT